MGGWSGSRGLAGGVGRWADRACEVTSKRVQWEGETQTLRGFCHWQGGFEQHYKIGAGRVETREKGKLGCTVRNLLSLAVAMAEIVKT
jgi:hypothetical protein